MSGCYSFGIVSIFYVVSDKGFGFYYGIIHRIVRYRVEGITTYKGR